MDRPPPDSLPRDSGDLAPRDLSPRERDVLRRVVQRFIDTAAPVGSRTVADDVDLSSASIRAVMARLEAGGYLDHPHTSAGRVPTERGYRLYVDGLMDVAGLSEMEAQLLRESVRRRLGDLTTVAHETSRLLGQLTRLLGVVLTPRLSDGRLERIEVVPLASHRVLFVLALRGGVARTIAAETDGEVRPEALDAVVQRLNERLAGLSLDEIRRTAAARVEDLAEGDGTGVVRVVLREGAVLFRENDPGQRAAIGGAHHLVAQPEFQAPEAVRDIVELAASERVVVHLLEQPMSVESMRPGRAVVRIGREVREHGGEGAAVSVVAAPYLHGGVGTGAVAVIGPTRMNYARAVALVEHLAGLLARE